MIPLRDENPTRRAAVVTLVLIILNVGVYFLVQPQGKQVLGDVAVDDLDRESTRFSFEYAAIPCEVTTGRPLSAEEIVPLLEAGHDDVCDPPGEGDPVFPAKPVLLAVLFSMFFHGSLVHLGGNMLFLWIFGNNIEDHLGPIRYLLFYLVSGVVATGAHVALQPESTVPLVGASGAVAGVMGAYLVWFPNARILTAFFVFFIMFRHITAKWLLGLWFVSQFFISPNAGVAWAAHVGGFVTGVVVGLVVRGSRAARRAAWRSPYAGARGDPWHGGDDRW